MNDFQLSPDDPKLTAYALGELEGDERAAVEAALRHDPAARAAVEEIRATAAQLESALAAESETEIEAETESIVAAAPVDEYRRPKPGAAGRLLQFPQVYFVVGGLAAACFALMAILNPPPPPAPTVAQAPERTYVPITIVRAPVEENMAVSLPPAAPAPAEKQLASGGSPLAPARKADSIPTLADAPRDAGATNVATVVVPATPAMAPAPVEDAANKNTITVALAEPAAPARETPAPTAPADAVEPAATRVAEASGTTTGAGASEVGEIRAAAPAIGGTLVVGEPKARAEPTRVPGESDVIALNAFTVATDRDRSLADSRALRDGRAGRSGPPSAPAGAKLGGPGAGSGVAVDNDFLPAEENPRSRIPLIAESSSYDDIRRVIEGGRLPTREMVRIEELVNHFPYRYPAPRTQESKPFAAALEVAAAPWAPTHRLVRIGLRGRAEPGAAERLRAIARDVRIEVEFNPAKVSSYRLIGYENARLRKEDYAAEKAGGVDVAAGHTLTALYEIVPVGAEERRVADRPAADDLRYQGSVVVSSRLEMPAQNAALGNELLMVTVHYKNPGIFSMTQQQEFPLTDAGRGFADASADFKFVAAVAQFGMMLRGSAHRGSATMGDVVAWAQAGATSNADDPRGHRGDFIGLARKTQVLLR